MQKQEKANSDFEERTTWKAEKVRGLGQDRVQFV